MTTPPGSGGAGSGGAGSGGAGAGDGIVRPELDRDATALWRQLKRTLRDMALTMDPGEKLPTEEELCRRHGVSRTTVRQAVASLVAEGVLFSRQGSGTYVAPRKQPGQEIMGLQNLARVSYRLEGSGARPGIRLVSVEETSPDKRLRQVLAVTGTERLYKVRRLRYADDEAVAWQVTYLSQRLFPNLTPADFERGSLRDLLRERFGLALSHLEASLVFATADSYHAEILGVREGDPLLLIDRVTYASSGLPVIHSRIFYRHDRSHIDVRVALDVDAHDRVDAAEW